MGSWTRGTPGQGACGGEVPGTAWEAVGLWGREGSRSDAMEVSSLRKVLGLCDAVGVTGDEDRERGSLAVTRLVLSCV